MLRDAQRLKIKLFYADVKLPASETNVTRENKIEKGKITSQSHSLS